MTVDLEKGIIILTSQDFGSDVAPLVLKGVDIGYIIIPADKKEEYQKGEHAMSYTPPSGKSKREIREIYYDEEETTIEKRSITIPPKSPA